MNHNSIAAPNPAQQKFNAIQMLNFLPFVSLLRHF